MEESPIDIVSMVNATEFKVKVESKKWSDRVEAIKVRSFLDAYAFIYFGNSGSPRHTGTASAVGHEG